MTEQRREMVICRCEEVTEEEILEAIREGAASLNDIKRRTRAGMGLCQGSTCRKIVSQIFAKEQGKALEDIFPSTFRPPVRPIKLGVLAAENNVEVGKDCVEKRNAHRIVPKENQARLLL
jgi:bacterioferritin-associated ferredoxin